MWPLMVLMLLTCDLGLGLPAPSQDRSLLDVYAVHTDKSSNTLVLVNPHPKRPTLRDITYYHVVETAYPGSQNDNAASKTGSTVSEDETERAFTNGHGQGYELIDGILPIALSEMDDANDADAATDDDFDDHGDVNSSQADAPSADETTYVYYDDEEITQDDGDNKTNDPKAEVQTIADEVDGDTEEVDQVLINFKGSASSTKDNTVTEETINDNDTTVIEKTTTEKTSTQKHNLNRHQKLFSSPDMLRERYLKMKNIIPTIKEPVVSKQRRKRSFLDTSELKDIPEAPKLGPINYDSLPKYIRAMVSTEKPYAKEEVTETIENRVHTYETEHEKHRESIRKKMEQFFSNIKAKETEVNDEIVENQEDGIINLKADKVRTYGMNITDDNGVIWNKVEEPINVEENKEVSSSQKPPYVNKPASSKPEVEFGEIEDNTDIVEPLVIDEDSNDIFVNINKEMVKDKPVPLSTDSSFVQNEDNETMKQDSIHEIPLELIPLAKMKEESIPESLNKLIEDEKFWDWITNWTAAYAELLIEHIGNTVKEEIEKQMSNKTGSVTQNVNANKDMELAPIDTFTEKPAEKFEIGTEANDDLDTEDATSKRNIIFTDEGEVVLEITPETDDQESLLKRRKNKDKNCFDNDNKIETSTEIAMKKDEKIVAQNIYGNAMGNQKVTNIFVFAPYNNTEMILKKLDILTENDGASNTNSVVIENRFSDISDNETEYNVDDNNKSPSGNQINNVLTSEKEKKIDTELSSKESSDKNQEKSDDIDKQDKTKVSNEHDKEIEDLKGAHEKEIEDLKNYHSKVIEKLESDYKKQLEKYERDEKNSDKVETEKKEEKIKEKVIENTVEDMERINKTTINEKKGGNKIESDISKEIEILNIDNKKEINSDKVKTEEIEETIKEKDIENTVEDMERRNETTINEKKGDNKIESDISKEIEKLNIDNKKEIRKLKSDFEKEIDTVKSDYMKEIETLKIIIIDQQKNKETKDDENIDAKSEGVDSKIDSKKSENDKETEKVETEKLDEIVIEKVKSDNQKEIDKLKSDHKKELEALEKEYKDEIENLKREQKKDNVKSDNKNLTISQIGKETEKPKSEEELVNDESKESESDDRGTSTTEAAKES